MTTARVCATVSATVGFVILFILILETRNNTTTVATTTSTIATTPTTTTTTTTTTNRPAVYFEATRDSKPGTVQVVTFEYIPITVGGGMFLNGSFIAPVTGVYW